MRKLQTKDLFCAMRIINAAYLKEDLKNFAELSQTGKADANAGLTLLFDVLGKLSGTASEKELYKLFGGLFEIEPKEVETMSPVELIDNFKKLGEVIEAEELKGFFMSLFASTMK